MKKVRKKTLIFGLTLGIWNYLLVAQERQAIKLNLPRCPSLYTTILKTLVILPNMLYSASLT
jgi:hypothetical protein